MLIFTVPDLRVQFIHSAHRSKLLLILLCTTLWFGHQWYPMLFLQLFLLKDSLITVLFTIQNSKPLEHKSSHTSTIYTPTDGLWLTSTQCLQWQPVSLKTRPLPHTSLITGYIAGLRCKLISQMSQNQFSNSLSDHI